MAEKQVIAYYRKSTEANGKGEEESVAYQQSRIHEYALDNGLTIVMEFIDVVVENSSVQIEEVLFYSIDRFEEA